MSVIVENKFSPTLYLLSREYEIRFPWKSPCVCALSFFSHVHFFVTYGLYSTRLLCPWDSPGKNTGVGCHAHLQRTSWPRNRTHVSCLPALASGLFTTSTTWETQKGRYLNSNLSLINKRTIKSYVEILNSWTPREIME